MTGSDENGKEPPPPTWARQILDTQRRTAKAIADLALGLSAQATTAQRRHEEITGLILACLQEPKSLAAGGEPYHEDARSIAEGERLARKHEDDSARIYLPGGTKIIVRSSKAVAILKGVGYGVLAGGGWLWHLMAHVLHR